MERIILKILFILSDTPLRPVSILPACKTQWRREKSRRKDDRSSFSNLLPKPIPYAIAAT
ncbi:hypothetical protein HQ563_18200 [bacterium]|nr:hypothetical protein [bacterium]